jgi:hypothetical protein
MNKEARYRLPDNAPTATVAPSREDIKFLTSMSGQNEQGTQVKPRGEPLLTVEEEIVLLRALSLTSPDGTFTQTEGEAVFEWAKKVRLDYVLLDSVLRGWLKIRIRNDGVLEFSAVDPEVILGSKQEHQDGSDLSLNP